MTVALCSVILQAPPGLLVRLARVLTHEERARAERLATPALRDRFVIARAALRILLGSRLGREPESIGLQRTSAGKPFLQDGELDFSLSHSGSLAVYAFTRGLQLGVDVEELRAMPNLLAIARRVFGPEEYAELAGLEASLQTESFLRCWTRKEAYLKAVGTGILAPLTQIEVTLLPQAVPALRHIHGDRAAAAEWHMHHLEPAAGYVGALATKGRPELDTVQWGIHAQALVEWLDTGHGMIQAGSAGAPHTGDSG